MLPRLTGPRPRGACNITPSDPRPLPLRYNRALPEFHPSTRFRPLLPNPHAATIATVFLRPHLDTQRFPVTTRLIDTGDRVKVRVDTQHPDRAPRAQLVLVHGLEGSSDGSYMRSLAQHALTTGYAVHRFNLRSCGGTEQHCPMLYHAGLTADLHSFLEHLRSGESRIPIHLVGFSLGGNVVLKLAGELGASRADLLRSVAAVSTPLDLEVCAREIGRPVNRLYEWNFVRRMKSRLRRKLILRPEAFSLESLKRLRTIYALDDTYTAPMAGFRDARHYYSTQSAGVFLEKISVPTLVVQAQDDPLIPFRVYQRATPLFENPSIHTLFPPSGGHLGFIARSKPHFWIDQVIGEWVEFVEHTFPRRSEEAAQNSGLHPTSKRSR
jgi:uncharacterized protein